MKKAFKEKILYFFSFFAIIFVFAFIANSSNAYADDQFVDAGKTLTIEGTGKLDATGGNANWNSGNVMINGGYIKAQGGELGAGIGSGYKSSVTIASGLNDTIDHSSITINRNNNLSINGVLVTDSNSSGEGWSYDKETNTLTLNGFYYDGEATVYNNFFGQDSSSFFGSIINYEGNEKLIINVIGENFINNLTNDDSMNLCGIHSTAELEFKGDGSLLVELSGKAYNSYAIASNLKVTVDGTALYPLGGNSKEFSYGLYTLSGVELISGELAASGNLDVAKSYGIFALDGVTIHKNFKYLFAEGEINAIKGSVITAIKGLGTKTLDEDAVEEKIEASEEGQDLSIYKYIELYAVTPEDVIALINAIGEVKCDDETKAKLDKALNAYNKLSGVQKGLVDNYDILATDVKKYNKISNVYELIEQIDNVKYNEESKELIEKARKAYNALSEDEKQLITNSEKLDEKQTEYNNLEKKHNLFVGWMVALIIIGSIVLILGIIYLLLFFVFNKWTLADGKPVRVFKLTKKADKVTLIKMSLIIIYRKEDEVLKHKNDIK